MRTTEQNETWRAPTTWTHRWRRRPAFLWSWRSWAMVFALHYEPNRSETPVQFAVQVLGLRIAWTRVDTPRVDWTRSTLEVTPAPPPVFRSAHTQYGSPYYREGLTTAVALVSAIRRDQGAA